MCLTLMEPTQRVIACRTGLGMKRRRRRRRGQSRRWWSRGPKCGCKKGKKEFKYYFWFFAFFLSTFKLKENGEMPRKEMVHSLKCILAFFHLPLPRGGFFRDGETHFPEKWVKEKIKRIWIPLPIRFDMCLPIPMSRPYSLNCLLSLNPGNPNAAAGV